MPELRRYWPMAAAAVVFRLALVFFPGDLNLGSRPEVATPLSSLRRLAEGYWLKQTSLSPYAGSMYHGSPLLLPVLGPLIVNRTEGRPMYFYCSLLFVIVDFISAILIRAIGQKLFASNQQSMNSLKLSGKKKLVNENAGDVASLIYLWNPLTIVTCLGSCTTPIDNFMVILTIYGACSRIAPLAAFGYVMATHLSLYPAILIVPVILLLGHGLDAPPSKLFTRNTRSFSWKPVIYFIIWAIIWTCYVLLLCSISLKGAGDLNEMFKNIPQATSRTSKKICTPGKNPGYAPDKIPELDILSCIYPNIPFKGTYGFILTVEDLTPNIGVLWYFFAEVFEFFRDFFLIVFHVNILFMVLPLAIRLKHRPCFLAFVYVAVVAMLKSYPSVGDSALYLGLLGLFASELADMQFSFFIFFGYIGVTLLSPVMHNLWIWRGTGNANFYFATGLAYACLQTVLVVESVSSMLKHDRMLKKLGSP